MKRWILALGAMMVMVNACKHKPEVLTLQVGECAECVDVVMPWKTTQDRLISLLRPHWEGLAEGHSAGFRFSRVVADPVTKKRVEMRAGDKVKVAATITYGAPEWRFFRNRDGLSGVEAIDDQGVASPMCSGADLDWERVERYLREEYLRPDRIGLEVGDAGDK